MSEKVNSVTASKFLEWYFSDSSMIRDFGNAMIDQLETFGKADISVEQLYDGCGYIPQSICEDYDGVYEVEYEPSDVEFINDLK
jgi:hypothetical protein